MKCGITLAKQQKLLVLEKSNANLEKELNAELQKYEQLAASIKIENKSSANVSAQIQLQIARNAIITSVTQAKRSQLEKLKAINFEDEESLKIVEGQNKKLNAKVYEQTQKWRAQQEVNERLSQQIKKFQSIGSSNANIVQTTQKIKNNYECLLRKLAIFQNKLESHYRYVQVLKKKEESRKDEGEKKEINKESRKVQTAKRQVQPKRKDQEKDEKEKKPEKKQMKSFDAMVRKKNQILMNSKRG